MNCDELRFCCRCAYARRTPGMITNSGIGCGKSVSLMWASIGQMCLSVFDLSLLIWQHKWFKEILLDTPCSAEIRCETGGPWDLERGNLNNPFGEHLKTAWKQIGSSGAEIILLNSDRRNSCRKMIRNKAGIILPFFLIPVHAIGAEIARHYTDGER